MKNIPYSKHSITREDIRAVVRALNADKITQGPLIEQFERSLARKLGAKYAVALSSGTAALHCALSSLGVKEGDEVITVPITFVATANSILYAGGRPRFIDIEKSTWHMNPELLKKHISSKVRRSRVKAVILVHLMGTVADLKAIRDICRRHGVFLIEDAAHALGAGYRVNGRWNSVGSCSHSEAAVFSFHPIKHITTGEGGALLTNSRRIYENVLRLRHHGLFTRRNRVTYDAVRLGFNYRITDFQCALGLSQLRRLNQIVSRRRSLVAVYNAAFKDLPLICPKERPDTRASYHLYVIRVRAKIRNRLRAYLKRRGIGTQINYPAIHQFSLYKRMGFRQGDFPESERYASEALSLPLFQALTDRDHRKVVESIKDFFEAEHGSN